MLFCIAFLFQFLIAGLTGIMLGAAPFDWQLSGSYFVVAHFHYVIVGGILFALFGAFYYWYPKITGRMMSESLGKLHFWLFVIGFHLTFDLMHIPGHPGHAAAHLHLRAGPRLGYVEPDLSRIGTFVQGIAILIFVANLILSYFKGAEGRKRSLGRLDSGMVGQFAAAALQLRVHPDGRQPTSVVGSQTSRRSGQPL